MADIKYTIVFDSKAAAEAAAKLDQAVGEKPGPAELI